MVEGSTRCPYKRYCHVTSPCDKKDFYECANYFHIDDIMNDARDMEREMRKEMDDYDCDEDCE